METLIDTYGENFLLFLAGGLVGLIFGAAAYQSRFCLRAATAEVAEGKFGPRLSIWLVAFTAAVFAVQGIQALGFLDVNAARQIANVGSLSGAIVGGLIFGAGMILARGCVSRLLVLSASGNLRAIVTGLVVTLTAQAALRGALAPGREAVAGLWTIPGGEARQIFEALPMTLMVGLCGAVFVAAIVYGHIQKLHFGEIVAAVIVGLAVCLGWALTQAIANASFEVVQIQSVTFTGPSTDTLMALVNEREITPGFGLGLVPGVFLGAMIVALLRGEARIQRFEPDTPMERYLIGGALMGFGSMLAGGCAVGAGMTGGAIFAVTAWVAVFCMWVGAVLTQWALAGRILRRPAIS